MARRRNNWRGQKALHGWKDYLRDGLPVGSMVVGFTMITGGWFDTGVALFFLGAAWLPYDFYNQAFFRRWSPGRRWALGILYLSLLVFVSRTWIFVPAQLQLYPAASIPTYGEGTEIAGIRWDVWYAQVQFSITNPSDNDYDNFDAEVSVGSTDSRGQLVIAAMGQIGGLARCGAAPVHPAPVLTVQSFVGGKPIGPLSTSRPNQGTDVAYRIRCPKIPAGDHNQFIAAIAVLNPDRVGGPLFLPPVRPQWLNLNAQFRQYGRFRHFLFRKCRDQSKCDLNRRFDFAGLSFGAALRTLQQRILAF